MSNDDKNGKKNTGGKGDECMLTLSKSSNKVNVIVPEKKHDFLEFLKNMKDENEKFKQMCKNISSNINK